MTACTPNESEVEQLLGIRIADNVKVLEKAGREILARTRGRAVLVTRGSRGMALFERDRPTAHVPIFGSDQIADVTGAGDTVIATMTLALAADATFLEAARLANYAGGIVVMKRGTATVFADELRQAILCGAPRSMSARTLVDYVRADRRAGRTIAFANDWFDCSRAHPLPAGVGGRSRSADRRGRRRWRGGDEGPGRPMMKAVDRAAIVAALRGVDYVVISPEPTVTPILALVEPDVHCKGTDYTVERCPKGYCSRLRRANRDRRRSEEPFNPRSPGPHRRRSHRMTRPRFLGAARRAAARQ